MARIGISTLRAARMGGVRISLTDLPEVGDAVTAPFLGHVPDWLVAELANDGVTIYKDRSGQWILDALND